MQSSDLCTEAEIAAMVHAFYAAVRKDPLLGPIFNQHVDDWDRHLDKLSDFWSSVLRGTRRFSGTPMPTHIGLPGLTPELFARWLTLFGDTAATLTNRAMGEQALALARRIAQSLWYGYELSGKSATGRGKPSQC